MSADRALIEQIAREVIARLGQTASSCGCSSGAGSVGGAGTLLVVVGGSGSGLDEAAVQLRQASAAFSGMTLYLTPCAEKSGGLGDELTRRLQPARVLRASQNSSVDEILSGAAAVVYPAPSMSTAAKVSMLITDSPATSIAVAALTKRIPVVMSTNALMAGLNAGGYTPPGFHEIGAENVRRLEKLGVRTCDIRNLAASLGSGGAAPSALPPESATLRAAAQPPSASVATPQFLGDIQHFLQSAFADDPSCVPCAAKVSQAIEQCIAAGACRIGTTGVTDPQAHTESKVARMIDHTLLKPNVTPDEIETLCAEARRYRFKSVCINPGYVALCKRLLQGSGVLVCTVVGFPLGATTTSAKASETRDAIADGADEIDMVINIGALKAGDYEKVKHDIEEVVEAAKGRTVKVILETSLLSDEEKVAGCQLSVAAGAHFVKTSTGFGGGGATAEDIALMRRVVGPRVGVKASGGVRTKEDADAMIAAGANRIGASASVSIVTGKKDGGKGY